MALSATVFLVAAAKLDHLSKQLSVDGEVAALPFSLLVSAFLGIFAVYILNAVTPHSLEDQINKPSRSLIQERQRRLGYLVASLCLVASIILFTFNIQDRLDLLISFILGAFAIGYFDHPRLRIVKSVAFFKSFWVSGAWTFAACVMAPRFAQPNHTGFQINVPLTCVLFLWLLIDTFLLDWNDQVGDRSRNILTLPQQVSARHGGRILLVASILTCGIAATLKFPQVTHDVLVGTGIMACALWYCAITFYSSAEHGRAAKTNLEPVAYEFLYPIAIMSWRFVLFGLVVVLSK